MRLVVEDASGKKLYVCLRCGHKFWSRAKKPQCSVCRSKRVMPYEEFLKLPEEEQARILGKKAEEKKEQPVKEVTAEVGESENEVKSGENEGLKPVENREVEVKREESPKIPRGEKVKSGDSPKVLRAHQGEKQGEKVKGEKVKRGISIPTPKLSMKAVGIILGLAFIYYLYKVGWFDSILEHLKFMKSSSEAVKGYEEERKRESPVLDKISKNLGG